MVTACVLVASLIGPHGPSVTYVPANQVRLTDSFWAPRIERNLKVTIPHGIAESYQTGRVANFLAAVGKADKFEGYYFNDSDVYKLIEGAARAIAIKPDPKIESEIDKIIDIVAAAQEPDGYLYTAKTCRKFGLQTPAPGERWSNTRDQHELYCMGHLMEAGVAYKEATGKDKLFQVAKRAADLVCQTFSDTGNMQTSGHEEVEIGLVAMFDATQDPKYLAQAKRFIDRRGSTDGRTPYGEYAQDSEPFLKQTKAVGHSVRAAYLYSGASAVAARLDDTGYDVPLEAVWKNVAESKLYLTGGIGASGSNEGFTHDFDLPNTTAYQETCAVIANILWNNAMFQSKPEGRFFDITERALYNGFLSGIGLDGKTFFYPNRLQSFSGEGRSSWFGCACCPPNVMRVFPQVPSWIYATSPQGLYVNLYAANTASVPLGSSSAELTMATEYPWSGTVKITVNPKGQHKAKIHLRIPGWAVKSPVPSPLYRYTDVSGASPSLRINGNPAGLTVTNGYAVIDRTWKAGDTLELRLPMANRFVQSDTRVEENTGRVALERGPIVYCAEFADQPNGTVLDRVVTTATQVTDSHMPHVLGGVTVLELVAAQATREKGAVVAKPVQRPLRLVPYGLWANRGLGQMAVWLPTSPAKAVPAPEPTLARLSKIVTSNGQDGAKMTEQLAPASSGDERYPFFHWWPRKGSLEWVQVDFPAPTDVSEVSLYWFDDTGRGECKVPQAWRIELKTDTGWQEPDYTEKPTVRIDSWNHTRFKKNRATSLKVLVQMQKDWATGIHELEIR